MKHRVVTTSPMESMKRVLTVVQIACLNNEVAIETSQSIANEVARSFADEKFIVTKQVSA